MSTAEQAEALLSDLLKDGPRPAADVLTAAANAGISERSIQRASIALGVVKTRTALRSGWTWTLPTHADDEAEVTKAPSFGEALATIAAPVECPIVSMEMTDRAEVIAARLRKLEAGRGKRAPIYVADPRVQAWASAGISDPDLKEAYERATTDHTGMLTAGIMDKYISEVMKETA